MINRIELDSCALATINRAILTNNDEQEERLYHSWLQANQMQGMPPEQSIDMFQNLRLAVGPNRPIEADIVASAVDIEEINAVAHSIGRD